MYDFYRQNVLMDNLYLESKNEITNLNLKYAYSDADHDTNRISMQDKLSYAQKIGSVELVPYAGVAVVYYSDNNSGLDDFVRAAPLAGVTLSTKLYKTFNTDFKLFGRQVDKMRHIITPLIEYSYQDSSNISTSKLWQYDGIDALDRQNKITFSLDNKLQAKNGADTWDMFYFSPYIDYLISDKANGDTFNESGAKLEFYPVSGISFTAKSSYDMIQDRFNEINADFTFTDPVKSNYSFSIGERYLAKDSSLGVAGFMFKFSPRFQLNADFAYDYRDNDIQSRSCTLRTDLHCWWFDTGVRVDDKDEFTIWFAFTLKAFPGVHFGSERSYASAKKEY